MLALEERRSSIQEELTSLTQQLSTLKDQLDQELSTGSSGASLAVPKTRPQAAPSAGTAPKGGGFRRGGLKEKVMSALENAGPEGVWVRDLAEQIGTKPLNIHSWFHSNIKRNPAIKKLDGGHYRLEGATSGTSTAPQTRASRAAVQSTESGRERGALKSRILQALSEAGPEGISISELAEKLDVNYKNISIWFATTGKKNAAIKRIKPATYRLAR